MNLLLDKKLNELNENQLKAVKHINEPLFVVAGAGTGKTNTLTTKIAYLINYENVSPENILALTFTNKAAREIRDRVNQLIYPYQMGSWLYTFHAFSLKILRKHASDLNLNYNNNFNIIDEDESKDIIRDVIKTLNIESKKISLGEAKSAISNHKMLIEPILDHDLLDIYSEYENELIRNNLMDFDDLVKYTYILFDNNEDILNKYKEVFKYVLVDEFQDTDKIQYEIIKLINSKNTFVVGDPDQSIYHFRGARYENNELFLKDFNAKEIILYENYRSTNNILNVANKVIKQNDDRTTKKDLKSNLGDGKEVVIERLNNDFQEVDYVIENIYRLKRLGVKNSDIAILYRNNAISRVFEHKLMKENIPYIIYGGISFYERKEVKDLLAYLKLVFNKNNDFYFKRVVNRPRRGIGIKTIESLEYFAMTNNLSLFEAVDKVKLPNRALNSLKEFKEIINNIDKNINELDNIKEVIDLVFNLSNYEMELEKDNPETKSNRLDNINELKTVFSLANSNYKGNNYEKIKQTLDELALFTDHEISYDYNDAIRLSTIHQVKGLEFDAVFVVALEENIFPNHRSTYETSKLNEERRLFYVSITRAKKHLYLTSAYQRRLYGQFNITTESRFIKEIIKNKINTKKIEEPKTGFTNKTSFNVGDKLNHISFGKGIVVNINDDVLQIAFNHPYGIKNIKASFDGIKKE